ncbi:MAG: hypothetical protein A3I77_01975 [Gammaproteobacteria bacterium RIFCSPLOWO2_02_FULL_42_14]|nr:MAG: hypothetical protein A3B71_00680 [Gammaproteobacteria bacterium RIFCSPHIGHO2_02_FULL_42_43]OGT28279.1 MAG: hypothetical protein A2624_02235 [Gammaproteobacteria bacterium RIFCSPHIGHO2_01_FULL_42_8]OGT52125.1 MAG: hypothetical protein A3E54_06810 [Gammaproteobacteria bacterium RIFCSPHIGHO2_12_FULL_41_25]OGT62562.1 MAG: hypothetical protein A3I77_01975 [Gammaproteobacteria bacterium RIFCSPLOWO2_02_FULL_42_14]OGT86545.1 MAG: hypothetical protein A3G86_08495 [Gammaproteobacteria bacterium R
MSDKKKPKTPKDPRKPRSSEEGFGGAQDQLPPSDQSVESEQAESAENFIEAVDESAEINWEILSDDELSSIEGASQKQKLSEKKEQKRLREIAARERRDMARNPEQRKKIMETQKQRGDIIEPESQRQKHEHAGMSSMKQHPLMSQLPQGSAVNLGIDPSKSPAAEARAQQSPELTPAPSAQAQNTNVARATHGMKPTPGK